jgi:hypothetical protein
VTREPGIALADLLDRMGEEAGTLALITARAEAALQSVLENTRGLPPGTGGDLQQIDLVRQSLEDFSRLLWIAAAASPVDRQVSPGGIHSAATLTGLASRLAGGPSTATAAVAETDEDLLLF